MQPLTTNARIPVSLAAARGFGQGSSTVISSQSHCSTPEPFCNQRGQIVGTLKDGWLEKSVDCSKHQLRTPPGWAIDVEHLRRLRALGANGVRLNDEQGRVWEAALTRFDRYGRLTDRGHGPQVALPLAWWSVRDKQQLTLWGDL